MLLTLAAMLTQLSAKEILTAAVRIKPQQVNSVVDLTLSASITTVIPIDGSIKLKFPVEFSERTPSTDCILETTSATR